jgi:hypothetical protein
MSKQTMPTQQYLRECFSYDPSTGYFTRIARPDSHFPSPGYASTFNTRHAGTRAGSQHNQGYWQIGVDGKMYLAHRLVWIWLHGSVPDGFDVDHINRVRDDNSEKNLRLATRSQNLRNVERTRWSTSGLLGARFDKRRQKKPWYATIRVEGRSKSLGRFKTAQEAHEVYLAAAKSLYGEFM